MNVQKTIDALIVEKDDQTASAVRNILEERGYRVALRTSREEAIGLLKERRFSLAVAGDAEGGGSPFDIMKDIVMTSPMTSMILISDLAKEDVEDKAEGYGILGHTDRSVRGEDMEPLLESFERILGSFSID